MKKILSLLSMLMITVMAFAGSYSDALHFEVNLMGSKAVDGSVEKYWGGFLVS